MTHFRYSAERKIEAVRRVVEHGRSVGDVAREFGVSGGSLFFWVRRYRQMTRSAAEPGAPRAAPSRSDAPQEYSPKEHGSQEFGSLVAYLRKTVR